MTFKVHKIASFLKTFIFRNEKKEEFMKQKRKEKNKERKKVEEQDVESEEKDKKAIEAYEKWLVSACVYNNVDAYKFAFKFCSTCVVLKNSPRWWQYNLAC